MTEFDFVQTMLSNQKSFYSLYLLQVRDMNRYLLKNPVHDSAFYKAVSSFYANITLLSSWLKLFADFNADPCSNILPLSSDFSELHAKERFLRRQ